MDANKPYRLPILSQIPYKLRRLIKYRLFTTKWEAHNFPNREATRYLKRLQHLSTLNFASPMEADLYKFIGNMNRLKVLNISIPIKDFSTKKDKPFPKLFKHLKDLHVLMLSSRENQEINDEMVENICKDVYKFRSLRTIILDFFRCYSLTEAGIVSCIKRFKKIKKLEALRTHYESCHDHTNKGTEQIGTHVAELKRLEDLKLTFCALSLFTSKIAEKSLNYLVDQLNKVKTLRKLVLHFRNCSMPSDKALESVSKNVSRIQNLTHLDLYLTGFIKLEDSGFRALGRNLSRMTSLEHLILDIRSCNHIIDDCLVTLFRELVPLLRLELLSLNFNYCPKLTNASLKGLSEFIPKFQSLKYLEIQTIAFSVFETNIEREGLLSLTKMFAELPKLISLALSIGNSTSLDDAFIDAMLEDIQRITNLTKFRLKFENMPKITDHSLILLAKKIANLPIDTINFSFENCYNFTDDGVRKFLTKLKKNKRLKDSNLFFVGCSNITEEMLQTTRSLSELHT